MDLLRLVLPVRIPQSVFLKFYPIVTALGSRLVRCGKKNYRCTSARFSAMSVSIAATESCNRRVQNIAQQTIRIRL